MDMGLQNYLVAIAIQLHCNPKLSRIDVQMIIEKLYDFTQIYNVFLIKQFLSDLKEKIGVETSNQLIETSQNYNKTISFLTSHNQRWRFFQNTGLYAPLQFETTQSESRENNSKTSTPCTIMHIPLKNTLKCLFEMENLFDKTISLKKEYEKCTSVLTNFVQGDLWKNQIKSLPHDRTFLPLFIYFDALEMKNPQGSHIKKDKIGCIYTSIPCLPSSFSSQLDSILLNYVFDAKNHTEFNKEVLKKLIAELKELRNEGLTITVDGKTHKIFFITSLIFSHNSDLNSILGLVDTYRENPFCRICNINYDNEDVVLRSLFEDRANQGANVLWTRREYDRVVLDGTAPHYGIKERCLFNEIEDFHVVTNSTVNIMHDVFEKVANRVIADILLDLIYNEKYIVIDYINEKLKSIYFEGEKHVPLKIDIEFVKKNRRLKMTASEILFFSRYLTVILDYTNPEYRCLDSDPENMCWKIYITLRRILGIITSPILSKYSLYELVRLVKKHHKLYYKCYSEVKAECHNMIHYVRLIEQNGPLIFTPSADFESKHRQVKEALVVSGLRRDAIKRIGIKNTLAMMSLNRQRYKKNYIAYGIEEEKYYCNSNKKYFKEITIDRVSYSRGKIIITDFEDIDTRFGKIEEIYVLEDEVYFTYTPYEFIAFSKYNHAYSVQLNEDVHTEIIKYNDLPTVVQCNEFRRNDRSGDRIYITTHHITTHHEL